MCVKYFGSTHISLVPISAYLVVHILEGFVILNNPGWNFSSFIINQHNKTGDNMDTV